MPANLPHLEVQGVDLARWQEQWMQSEPYTQQLAYWQRQLHALPSADVLPPDYPRGRFQTYQSAWLREWIPAPVAQQLQTWGQREGATLYMTVLTGLLIWLYGQHEQEDLVVGTDMVTRMHRESEGVVGFFINQLVLRCSFANHPSVREALQRVRQGTIDAYNHQGVPFEAVVEAVCPKREVNRTPLFQLKLISLPANQAMPAVPGLDVQPFDFEKNTASFDLVIYLQEEGDGRLRLEWNYNTALFAPTTITRMAQGLLALLPQLADQPETLINKLRMPLSREEIVVKREERPMEKTSTSGEGSNPFRFKKVTPKPVQLNAQALVRTEPLIEGSRLPLLVQPVREGIDLYEWIKDQHEQVEAWLTEYGAILWRGFGVKNIQVFEKVAQATCRELFQENGEHPREQIGSSVYTPTFFPAHQKLWWHNENSFNWHWPTKILFCCIQTPQQGGETPLVDSCEVFRRLDPDLRERFIARQVRYERSYGLGVGLNWQAIFQTDDRREVEERCRREQMEYEWVQDGQLKTWQVRPAVMQHEHSKEWAWFNQAQHWHPVCLDVQTRAAIEAVYGAQGWPRNCRYGDGREIADEEMESIMQVYKQLEVSFQWQEGDVLLVDNIQVAHGRNPFTGERKLLVALGDMACYPA